MTQDGVDLGSSVGYALKVAATALRAAMETALRPLDLSVSQYSCLELLGHRPGLSAAELARGTFVTRQSAHTLLQGLERRGLLERPPMATTGRALPTRLTEHGADVLAHASRVVADVERRMLQGTTPATRNRMLTDLSVCTAALESTPGTPAPEIKWADLLPK